MEVWRQDASQSHLDFQRPLPWHHAHVDCWVPHPKDRKNVYCQPIGTNLKESVTCGQSLQAEVRETAPRLASQATAPVGCCKGQNIGDASKLKKMTPPKQKLEGKQDCTAPSL